MTGATIGGVRVLKKKRKSDTLNPCHRHHSRTHPLVLRYNNIFIPRVPSPLFKLGGLQSMAENHAKTIKEQTKEESKKKCGIMVGKSVSQHFHLYMASLFVAGFIHIRNLGQCFLSLDL